MHGNNGFRADVVVCTEVIEHVEDYEVLLDNLIEMLNPGGTLVITTQSGKIHATEISVGHVRHFRIEQLCQALEEKGMKVITRNCWGWPGYVALKYLINFNSEQAIQKFGGGRYGTAAKILNHLSFAITRITSFRNSRWGSQIVISAQK
jgi:ubiquinone/menaquinone biosynthesis C-methylase UbiE